MGEDQDRQDDSDALTLFGEQREPVNWPVARLFRDYGWDYKWVVAVALVGSVLSPLVSLVPTYMLSVAIDAVLLDNTEFALPLVSASVLPEEQFSQLYLVVGIILTTSILGTCLSWVGGLAWGKFSQEVQHVIRVDAYRKIQQLGFDFFDSQQTGQVLSILTSDVTELNRLLQRFLGDILKIVTRFLGIGAILLYLHWQLALVSLVFLPILVVMSRYFVSLIQPKHRRVRQYVGRLNARIDNNLNGIQVIKAYTTEDYEADRVESASERLLNERWDVITTRLAFLPSMNLVNWIGFCVLLIVGGIWIATGPPLFFTKSLSVGILVSFLMYNRQFTQPLIQGGQLLDRYFRGRASVVRVYALREYDVNIETDDDAVAFDHIDGRITFDSVSFSYDGEDTTLDAVSFEVKPGEFVGICGPTGAGKTTLMKLLMRYYDPTEGRITIDGHDLRDVDVQDLRSAIGMVAQEQYLFSGTVRENIAYGNPDATDEDVKRAARMANAHNFISGFSKGYDTQVGQRGSKLSGGQRQRIAIARAVLKVPDLLILDEATSHVDNETEVLIQQSLLSFAEGRTTFAIAHQLSTIRHADTILVLDDGSIVERGSHEELVELDGVYANLWRMQVGEFDDLSDEFLDVYVAE